MGDAVFCQVAHGSGYLHCQLQFQPRSQRLQGRGGHIIVAVYTPPLHMMYTVHCYLQCYIYMHCTVYTVCIYVYLYKCYIAVYSKKREWQGGEGDSNPRHSAHATRRGSVCNLTHGQRAVFGIGSQFHDPVHVGVLQHGVDHQRHITVLHTHTQHGHNVRVADAFQQSGSLQEPHHLFPPAAFWET